MNIIFCDRDDAPDGALVIPLSTAPGSGADLAGLPTAAQAVVLHAATATSFTGRGGEAVDTYVDTGRGMRRVMLVGIGTGEYERAGSVIAERLMTSGETGVTVLLDAVDAADAADLALGILLRGWRFDRYRTEMKPKDRITLGRIVIVGAEGDVDRAWSDRQRIAEGVFFARALVTEPGNVLYPESFVARCEELAALGVEITVLDADTMSELGMGALLGVARGSARPPRVLAMRWDGTGGSGTAPVAFVGKGVTFDSGGISIKPSANMADMKWDMGGAAAVAGAIKAVAGRRAKAHVIGVCGLVENMPDGNAQRPGDIVTSMSGKTIEVLDTDAEGRLVLSDVLTWVQQVHRPHTVVDLATLTGAINVALGHGHAGMFANDDALAEQLGAAGKASGEKLWRMPLDETYDRLIDSDIADMKNIGPRPAGAITAAHFLQRFIDDGVRWAHLDVAGVVWSEKPGSLHGKGATGFGVRLLDRFVSTFVEASN